MAARVLNREVDLLIVVDGDEDAVADRLRLLGVEVSGAGYGTVSGRASPSLLPAIRAVDGVDSVEQSRTVQIAPPDADVQ